MTPGCFVVSLDFELHWGVRDHSTVEAYRANLLGARDVVPSILELFARHDIAATWATVGMLFAESRRQLELHIPSKLPAYTNKHLSPYHAMDQVGVDEAHDPFHFAASLIRRIAATPRQELGTHTFSHYFCLAEGHDAASFDADLKAAVEIARPFGATCASLVFPRTQVNPLYFGILRSNGVKVYRSSGTHWAYRPSETGGELPDRAFRLADAYLPLAGWHKHARISASSSMDAYPRDVPASAFLRPYSPALRRLDGVRMRRLTSAMTWAARRGNLFHLWWHPHNFGAHPRESMGLLSTVIDHYCELRRRFSMESCTMAEAARITAA